MKQYKFVINGLEYAVEIKEYADNVADIEVNGTPFKVEVTHKDSATKTPKIKRPVVKAAPSSPEAAPPPAGGGVAIPVTSPLPGTILQILVKPGDAVKRGDKLLLMEAMKMENNIQAEQDGVVKSIKVSAGDNVLQGAVLLEME